MKEAIGHLPVYTFIMLFIVITFGFLSATLMYYKAFKLNSRVAYALEEFEGYNDLSAKEIDRVLGAMGYRIKGASNCSERKNMTLLPSQNPNYNICIYESKLKNRYFHYGIVTYIYLDIPVVGGTFKIPVYAESERMFRFSS